jgi:hypothetical protein
MRVRLERRSASDVGVVVRAGLLMAGESAGLMFQHSLLPSGVASAEARAIVRCYPEALACSPDVACLSP